MHCCLAAALALVALFFIKLHAAGGVTPSPDGGSAGHRLAEAWCKDCHTIDGRNAGATNTAPDFVAIANQPSTTELALKVFLRSSHRSMPNLVIKPDQADDLVQYILSLKRN
jgi:mono/diheme cytochrome c family protein